MVCEEAKENPKPALLVESKETTLGKIVTALSDNDLMQMFQFVTEEIGKRIGPSEGGTKENARLRIILKDVTGEELESILFLIHKEINWRQHYFTDLIALQSELVVAENLDIY